MSSINFAPEWIEHDGKGCPFEVGECVKHRHRDGRECVAHIHPHAYFPGINMLGQFSTWCWAINGRPVFFDSADIIAYKLVNPMNHGNETEAGTRVGEYS